MVELIRTTKKNEPLLVEVVNKVNNLELKVESISELTDGLVDIVADNIVDTEGDK